MTPTPFYLPSVEAALQSLAALGLSKEALELAAHELNNGPYFLPYALINPAPLQLREATNWLLTLAANCARSQHPALPHVISALNAFAATTST